MTRLSYSFNDLLTEPSESHPSIQYFSITCPFAFKGVVCWFFPIFLPQQDTRHTFISFHYCRCIVYQPATHRLVDYCCVFTHSMGIDHSSLYNDLLPKIYSSHPSRHKNKTLLTGKFLVYTLPYDQNEGCHIVQMLLCAWGLMLMPLYGSGLIIVEGSIEMYQIAERCNSCTCSLLLLLLLFTCPFLGVVSTKELLPLC